MLKVGYQYLDRSPVLSFAPGCAMFVTVLGFNFLGDGLRHAPRSNDCGNVVWHDNCFERP